MSGLISASGLITGIDSASLIAQLMQLERQPILRMEDRIEALETERDAVRDLRTQLQAFRNRVQDFRLSNIFDAFQSASSEETVLTSAVSSSNPVVGSFEIDVTQLASSTVGESSATMGSAIAPGAALDSSGISAEITAGTFSVNGVAFTVDPTTDTLTGVLGAINASAAGVTATYNAGTDTVTFENTAAGDTSIINFSATDDDSNFLTVIAVTEATQQTNGSGSTEVTSTRHLGAIDATDTISAVSFAGGAITTGTFSINGISISIDSTTDSISGVIERINGGDAGVTASYDTTADTIRVVSDTLGSRTINFGGAGDTSNFLTITNLTAATQTAGNDAEFTVNGGATQTRNTNEVSDAIAGVTLNLLSTGTSTVTVSSDDDTIVEEVEEFLTEFNNSVAMIRDLTGSEGALSHDGGIRGIDNFLWQNVFARVTDISGEFDSLIAIGITTGSDFDVSSGSALELDADAFREALRANGGNVEELFHNTNESGIADLLFGYLDDATKTTGFLNNRAKANGTIDQQISNLNDQIDRVEQRVSQRSERLRRQFTMLEQISAGFQNQSAALAGIASF